MHLDGGYSRRNDKDEKKESESKDSGAQNNDKPKYGSDDKSTKGAIEGFKLSFPNGGDNANNNETQKKDGNNTLANVINGDNNKGNGGEQNK